SWLFLARTDQEDHVLSLEGVGLESGGAGDLHVGLFHVGWEVPDVWEFWKMHRRLSSTGLRFEAVDEGIRWTLRLADPDGNGLEIYLDTRDLPQGRREWGGQSQPIDEGAVMEAIQGMIPGVMEVDAREAADGDGGGVGGVGGGDDSGGAGGGSDEGDGASSQR
ncbi:MAG TPA: hypothetical protein VK966_03345, partial [Longimicrobiales bacterium]|nr:hypothetical protein [Longimicrobiales bacterium]